ncbi:unnamed protein product [Moneuplotes crassus]|uniref:Uncharacterized protein n=1 Tax=Euplotes crassus TaxID=5936 RepID=A0AAD1X903_EUPCR|nr:unnamed protein product [Moneuplotes crassus]
MIGRAFAKKQFVNFTALGRTTQTCSLNEASSRGFMTMNSSAQKQESVQAKAELGKSFMGSQRSFSTKIPSYFKEYQQIFEKSGTLEKIVPRKIETHQELENMGCAMYRPIDTDIQTVNKGLFDPLYDLLDCGGKRWRPVYGMILASDYGVDIRDFKTNESLYHLLGLAEIIHNASLICDDIEDKSLMRRGQPCAYIKYGQDVAINMGCYLMTYVMTDYLLHFNGETPELKAKIGAEISKEISCLHFGQNWDICWHNNYNFPNQDEYFQMTASKTGVIPRLIATLVSTLYGSDPEKITRIQRMTDDLGIAFQIQDDVIAIESDLYAQERGIFGEDIHEGKRTLMVIHSCNNLPKKDAKRLVDILNLHTEDEDIIREAIDLINSTNSIEYAKDVARGLVNNFHSEMDELIVKDETKSQLREFAEFLTNRDI